MSHFNFKESPFLNTANKMDYKQIFLYLYWHVNMFTGCKSGEYFAEGHCCNDNHPDHPIQGRCCYNPQEPDDRDFWCVKKGLFKDTGKKQTFLDA